jgi:hypothetical protein
MLRLYDSDQLSSRDDESISLDSLFDEAAEDDDDDDVDVDMDASMDSARSANNEFAAAPAAAKTTVKPARVSSRAANVMRLRALVSKVCMCVVLSVVTCMRVDMFARRAQPVPCSRCVAVWLTSTFEAPLVSVVDDGVLDQCDVCALRSCGQCCRFTNGA